MLPTHRGTVTTQSYWYRKGPIVWMSIQRCGPVAANYETGYMSMSHRQSKLSRGCSLTDRPDGVGVTESIITLVFPRSMLSMAFYYVVGRGLPVALASRQVNVVPSWDIGKSLNRIGEMFLFTPPMKRSALGND